MILVKMKNTEYYFSFLHTLMITAHCAYITSSLFIHPRKLTNDTDASVNNFNMYLVHHTPHTRALKFYYC